MLCRVYRSVCGVRHSVQYIDKLGATSVAWASHISITDTDTTHQSNVFDNKIRLFRKIVIMSACVRDALSAANYFYKYFVCFQLVVTIFVGTLYILLTRSLDTDVYLINVIFHTAEMEMFPILLCTAIKSEIHKINADLRNAHYRIELNFLKKIMTKCIRKFGHDDAVMDSGFFEIDIQVITIIINFVSLFVFAQNV